MTVFVVVDVDDRVVVGPLSDDPLADETPLLISAVLEVAVLFGEAVS